MLSFSILDVIQFRARPIGDVSGCSDEHSEQVVPHTTKRGGTLAYLQQVSKQRTHMLHGAHICYIMNIYVTTSTYMDSVNSAHICYMVYIYVIS